MGFELKHVSTRVKRKRTMANTYKDKCIEILKGSHVADLEPLLLSSVIEIDSTVNLYDAFQILLKNNILSAPVWDAESGKYTGFLDVRDLAGFVVFVYDTQQVHDNTQLADVIVHGQQQFKTIGTDGITIKYLSRRNRFHPVSHSSSLFEVCEALAAPDIHRVPIVKDGKVVKIISQTTIIKKIHVVIDTSTDPSLADLKIGTHQVVSVPQTEKVINTFRKMEKLQKSGIAIVNAQNRLVGTTTAKDLGLFMKNPTLQALQGNIFDYLKQIRQEQIGDDRNPCISVMSHEKLSRAIGLLAATRVHRIFIVDNDENFSASAVLSITDVLKFLLQK